MLKWLMRKLYRPTWRNRKEKREALRIYNKFKRDGEGPLRASKSLYKNRSAFK